MMQINATLPQHATFIAIFLFSLWHLSFSLETISPMTFSPLTVKTMSCLASQWKAEEFFQLAQ